MCIGVIASFLHAEVAGLLIRGVRTLVKVKWARIVRLRVKTGSEQGCRLGFRRAPRTVRSGSSIG